MSEALDEMFLFGEEKMEKAIGQLKKDFASVYYFFILILQTFFIYCGFQSFGSMCWKIAQTRFFFLLSLCDVLFN